MNAEQEKYIISLQEAVMSLQGHMCTLIAHVDSALECIHLLEGSIAELQAERESRAGSERMRKAYAPQKQSRVADLLADATDLTGLLAEEICSPRRDRSVFEARAAIAYVAVTVANLSGARVGRILDRGGNTVNSSVLSAQKLIHSNPRFAALVEELSARARERMG